MLGTVRLDFGTCIATGLQLLFTFTGLHGFNPILTTGRLRWEPGSNTLCFSSHIQNNHAVLLHTIPNNTAMCVFLDIIHHPQLL